MAVSDPVCPRDPACIIGDAVLMVRGSGYCRETHRGSAHPQLRKTLDGPTKDPRRFCCYHVDPSEGEGVSRDWVVVALDPRTADDQAPPGEATVLCCPAAKARHVVKNLHYQSSHLILRKFKTIILSHFSAKGCTARSSHRIRCLASSDRGGCRLHHSTPGAKRLRGSEADTSMTCGRWGHLNRKLGSPDTLSCPVCTAAGNPWSMGRDVHAARTTLRWFLV